MIITAVGCTMRLQGRMAILINYGLPEKMIPLTFTSTNQRTILKMPAHIPLRYLIHFRYYLTICVFFFFQIEILHYISFVYRGMDI